MTAVHSIGEDFHFYPQEMKIVLAALQDGKLKYQGESREMLENIIDDFQVMALRSGS